MRKQQKKNQPSRQDRVKKHQSQATKTKISLARANATLARRIETLLLVPSTPLTQAQLSIQLNANEWSVRLAVRQLRAEYARRNSPFILVDDADGWRFIMIENLSIYHSTTHRPPSVDDEPLSFQTTDAPSSRHSMTSEVNEHVAPLDENHTEYKEFLDELNEKISAIAHHNKNNNVDATLREKLLSDIEGLMHSVPAPLAVEELRHETAPRRE